MSIFSEIPSGAREPYSKNKLLGARPVVGENGMFSPAMMLSRVNYVAPLKTMKDMTQIERLHPVARSAWKRLEAEFPLWVAYLGIRDGELEFAVPAPVGSDAGHLVAFTYGNDLWVRFSPPRMCYAIDDEDEMVSIIRQLTADEAVFKVTTKGDEWVETTLTRPHDKCEPIPGHSVRWVSWSGRFDGQIRLDPPGHYCFLNLNSYSAPSTELVRIR
jgi:hypothetical protein